MKRAPEAERPRIPGGYLKEKRLSWSWAEARLVESRNYWVATVTPGGGPHARPVWGVWVDQRFYFSSGSRIRKHLVARPRISVNLESGDECIILEGTTAELGEDDRIRDVTAAYNAKYNWNLEPRAGEFFEVQPRVVFAWLCDGSGLDGGALFSQSATRWLFDGPET